MAFEIKLLEVISFNQEFNIHPTEVAKGDFKYWTELSTLLGIDLQQESEINASFEE
jgi:hypothetical protein|tara:strand:+ start:365 stop:532 length:168 start_codon:yes stop_codon:yes gene_type:complete